VLDLTEGRVCQIHKEAIEKLRAKMARWNTE
ncbi:MAG: RNA polymerase sigma factor FliA, partial [Candidatus Hydrogenedentes bacterium]|nr:RNA polymerase sigma factor FliA [Candidatus Hydrogenedentota bacterium]